MTDADLVLRLLVAGALGGFIGAERELADEVAGFRTHVLVAMGACLFSEVGIVTVGTDPTRIAAQVVSGIGFLGAAAIIRSGTMVRGVANAASLWLVAAVGMAVAFDRWTLALVATAVGLFVLRVVRRLESVVLGRFRTRRAELVITPAEDQNVDALLRRLRQAGVLVRRVEYTEGVSGRTLSIALEVPGHLSPNVAPDAVRPLAEVRQFSWSS